jgi:hypothetical protein
MDKVRTPQINIMMEYIVDRAFPNASFNERKLINGREDVMQAIAQFREQLKGKSDEEIKRLYNREKQKEKQLYRQQVELQDQQRFFTKDSGKVDFELFSKMTHWTTEEAVSLSFGKDPKAVKWDLLNGYKGESSFAKEFLDRKNLIERALKGDTLKYRTDEHAKAVCIDPPDFIAWAIKQEIPIPAEIKEMASILEKRSIDWETRCKELQAEVTALQEKLKHLEKPFDSKRELTYQKVVHACVVLPAKFNAEAKRNSATTSIITKIETAGLKIDKEALLAVLRDSSECCENLINSTKK